MFRDELELFAEACQTGRLAELSARDGNVALAMVDAALISIERKGVAVRLDEVIGEARARMRA
jgi:hypothetical protein